MRSFSEARAAGILAVVELTSGAPVIAASPAGAPRIDGPISGLSKSRLSSSGESTAGEATAGEAINAGSKAGQSTAAESDDGESDDGELDDGESDDGESDDGESDDGESAAGGTTNAGTTDAGTTDAGTTDAGARDAGATSGPATTEASDIGPSAAAASTAAVPVPVAPSDSLLVRLEGFEGPLDLLLDLARAQKVDLAKISILALVEQYLAVIEGARRIRLELAADWLVMAAWLAWLKSKLLLPEGAEAEEAETAADVLAARLRNLQAMRAAALWLGARPRLGVDVFARGAPEDHIETDRSRLVLDLTSLVRAYVQVARRAAGARRSYRPRPVSLWSVQDALARLARLLGWVPDWTSLEQFLPEELGSPLQRRAALASTLMAGLEMARGGTLRLRQEAAFGPILLRRDVGGKDSGGATVAAGLDDDADDTAGSPDDARRRHTADPDRDG